MKVKINGAYWVHYNNFSLTTNLDSVGSTFELSAFFDPDNVEHQKIFKPCQFWKIQFYTDEDILVSTGRIVSHSFSSAATSKLVCLSGYSFGGTFEDCQIPISMYPLESNGRSLREIAQRLCDHFGIQLHVYDSAQAECDQPIEKSVAQPTETIKNYLAKIASQLNVVFSHDVFGGLIFFKPDAKSQSKAFLTGENTLDMVQEVNGQGLHSTLTQVGQPGKSVSYGGDDSKELSAVETVTNPLVKANRPFVDLQSVGKETGTADGARDSLAVELKNIRIVVKFDRWQQAISIGDIVEVQNKAIYLYQKTRLMVATTVISADSTGENMTMTLMLPETFTGDTPNANLWSV